MKTKRYLILALLVSGGMSAQAQPPANAGPKKGEGHGPRRIPPELLAKYDKDGNGELSKEEKTAMREDMRAARQKMHKEMLEKYDADKDGKLSPEERKTARAAKHAEILEKYDADKDGKLSAEERKAVPLEDRPMFGRGPGGRGPGGRKGGPEGGPQGPPPAPGEGE